MLVLARHPEEAIRIGSDIRIVILRGSSTLVGVEAPRNIIVDREEIYLRKRAGLPLDTPPKEGRATRLGVAGASALTHLAVRFRSRAGACMNESRSAPNERDVIRLATMASTLDWAATELEAVARQFAKEGRRG